MDEFDVERYTLKEVQCAKQKRAFHHIQRTALFMQSVEDYDLEFNDTHYPQPAKRIQLILEFNHQPIGITTLDILNKFAAVTRSVAIEIEHQGKGHGLILETLVQHYSRSLGLRSLYVNAASEKTLFYKKAGFVPYQWDKNELVGIENGIIEQMKVSL